MSKSSDIDLNTLLSGLGAGAVGAISAYLLSSSSGGAALASALGNGALCAALAMVAASKIGGSQQ